jgi:hypothetical protein
MTAIGSGGIGLPGGPSAEHAAGEADTSRDGDSGSLSFGEMLCGALVASASAYARASVPAAVPAPSAVTATGGLALGAGPAAIARAAHQTGQIEFHVAAPDQGVAAAPIPGPFSDGLSRHGTGSIANPIATPSPGPMPPPMPAPTSFADLGPVVGPTANPTADPTANPAAGLLADQIAHQTPGPMPPAIAAQAAPVHPGKVAARTADLDVGPGATPPASPPPSDILAPGRGAVPAIGQASASAVSQALAAAISQVLGPAISQALAPAIDRAAAHAIDQAAAPAILPAAAPAILPAAAPAIVPAAAPAIVPAAAPTTDEQASAESLGRGAPIAAPAFPARWTSRAVPVQPGLYTGNLRVRPAASSVPPVSVAPPPSTSVGGPDALSAGVPSQPAAPDDRLALDLQADARIPTGAPASLPAGLEAAVTDGQPAGHPLLHGPAHGAGDASSRRDPTTLPATPADRTLPTPDDQNEPRSGELGPSSARVTVGEGDSRVALWIAVRGESVRVEARAHNAAYADALNQRADELAANLADRGLQLGSLSAGVAGERSGQPSAEPQPRDDRRRPAEPDRHDDGTDPNQPRPRGVRAIA